MILFKYIMMALTVLSTTVCTAQFKHQKIETVTIYGNCKICKQAIEESGSIKKTSYIDWNKDTKIATILYDSIKTSKNKILKRIALAGYDSNVFLAPNDTYANLPSCCQYKSAKIYKVMGNHINHSKKATKIKATSPLDEVYKNYFAIKNALVQTDETTALSNAKKLLKEVEDVKMNRLSMDTRMVWMKVLKGLKEQVKRIAETNEITQQRTYFNLLSKNIYKLIKVERQATPTYHHFCPMANKGKGANWLSKKELVENPYYGLQMLGCGSVVEKIK